MNSGLMRLEISVDKNEADIHNFFAEHFNFTTNVKRFLVGFFLIKSKVK